MIGNNGFGDVTIQDPTTEPINDYFLDEVSAFTISTDTGESGLTSFVLEFNAVTGHGITAGKEIILLDVASNRSLYAVAKTVTVNVIVIDRPIDHDFKAASTLGKVVTSNLNVVGSQAAPKIFTVRSGAVPQDFLNFKITMSDNAVMDDTLFGSRAALPYGLVFRIKNSFQKTIFTFKTNADFSQYGLLKYPEKVPSGTYAINAALNFRDERGVALRVQDTDVLQWIVFDDLSSIASIRISSIGHKTVGET